MALTVVVSGQILYHTAARGADSGSSPFALATTAYVVALGVVVTIGTAFGHLRLRESVEPAVVWRGALLGIAVALVELGYIYAYRRGLPITTGAVGALAITTVALVPIGLIAYRESLSARSSLGVLITLVGIWLIRS